MTPLTRGHRESARCICCWGTTSVIVSGPSVWKIEVLCYRCNVSACGVREYPGYSEGGGIDKFLRKYGCRSRKGKPTLRHKGKR